MIPLGAVRSVLYLLPPLVVVLIQNLSDGGILRGLTIIAISTASAFVLFLIYQVLNWAFYTYRYEEGYLHIKSGVVFKKERSIKRERVQTVNIRRGLLQRLLGLASLQVETAGGGAESEMSLTAVTLEEANNIKDALEKPVKTSEDLAVLNGIQGGDAAGESDLDERIYRISYPELFLAGATSGRFLLLFSVLAAVFSQLVPFIPETFWETVIDQITSTAAATIVLVGLILLLLSWLISALAFMVQNANFTVKRQNNSLQISWGLIEQKQLTLKMHRLQAISIQEGIIRQPLGRCALAAEVAGGGSRDQDYTTVLFPLIPKSELKNFLSATLPEYDLPEELVPLPSRARRRYIIRALLTVLPVIIPLQWAPYGWLAFLLLIPAFFWGLSRYYAAGTSFTDTQLTLGFRMINRYRVLVRRNNLQALQLSSNPFQRWWALRTLQVWVLSSPSGKAFNVTDVDFEKAALTWQWYSHSHLTSEERKSYCQ